MLLEILSANPHPTGTASPSSAVLAACHLGEMGMGMGHYTHWPAMWPTGVLPMTLGWALPPLALYTEKQCVPARESQLRPLRRAADRAQWQSSPFWRVRVPVAGTRALFVTFCHCPYQPLSARLSSAALRCLHGETVTLSTNHRQCWWLSVSANLRMWMLLSLTPLIYWFLSS